MTDSCICETQIPNGPRVISHTMPDAQTVSLGIMFDVGSRDETAANSGIAHALEHMLFKGTKRHDVYALSRLLDALGGNANALTGRERTCFTIHVLHEDWPEALDILAEMVLEASIPVEEWRREREVIFAEMGMIEDNPEEWLLDQHIKALFPGHSVGMPTLGSQASLNGFKRQDLADHLDCYYRSHRMLITAAGRIDHKDLANHSGRITWREAGLKPDRARADMASGVQCLPRPIEQVHIILSFPGIPSASDERPAAWLANQILGGGMSSRLFQEVREKRGLAYNIGSHLSSLSDTGMWSISCATDPGRLAECAAVIQQALQDVASNIDSDELELAKRQLEVQLRMSMDSVEGNMLRLGARFDEEDIRLQGYWVERIREVEVDEVLNWVVNRLAAKPLWSLCGPEKAVAPMQAQLPG